MKKLIIGFLLSGLLAGCGSDNTITSPPTSPGGGGTPTTTVATVEVLASSPSLPSDNAAPVTITARVLNTANQALANESVTIQTSSGFLTDIQTTTNANGVATAVLHTSDPTNRNVTVTATAGAVSDTVTIAVTGTRLTISGSNAIVQGDTAEYTITLLNAGDDGISGRTVTIASASGNALSATSLITDSSGQATVTLTGTAAGSDTLTATSLGLSATQTLSVSNDTFAFTAPAANAEIKLDNPLTPSNPSIPSTVENLTPISVSWSIGNINQVGQTIQFATTRGTVYQYASGACTATPSSSAVTDGSGVATACIAATSAGPATLSATTSASTVAQRTIEFVADQVETINVQASPTTVASGGQSTITAVVRDPSNNLVKNKTIVFTLNDVTGGTLTVGSAVTDSQGRAQTVYTASSVTSAASGVEIEATEQVSGKTASTTLTVARRELFISMGTGNELEDDVAQYRIPYVIQVTDANGNGVPNIPLTVRVGSLWYSTGERLFDTTADAWDVTRNDVCLDEDLLLGAGSGYRNGILDEGEDFNQTGRLEAGNIATVTPGTVTTDADGFADIEVVYPQEYASWMKVELSASTSVQGTESVRSVSFVLPGSEEDFGDADSNPPGPVSPFGIANYNCPNPSTFP